MVTASARAVHVEGLAAAGTSVMFGFVPLAVRGLYADGLSTWPRNRQLSEQSISRLSKANHYRAI